MHTPGPWSEGIALDQERREVTPVYGSGVLVAECPAYVADERPMVAANARLIAAAPDLLAALLNAEFLLRKCGINWKEARQMADSMTSAAQDARAAIVKATGG